MSMFKVTKGNCFFFSAESKMKLEKPAATQFTTD